jgi:hypothetical protein
MHTTAHSLANPFQVLRRGAQNEVGLRRGETLEPPEHLGVGAGMLSPWWSMQSMALRTSPCSENRVASFVAKVSSPPSPEPSMPLPRVTSYRRKEENPLARPFPSAIHKRVPLQPEMKRMLRRVEGSSRGYLRDRSGVDPCVGVGGAQKSAREGQMRPTVDGGLGMEVCGPVGPPRG